MPLALVASCIPHDPVSVDSASDWLIGCPSLIINMALFRVPFS